MSVIKYRGLTGTEWSSMAQHGAAWTRGQHEHLPRWLCRLSPRRSPSFVAAARWPLLNTSRTSAHVCCMYIHERVPRDAQYTVYVLFVWVLQKQLRCAGSSSFSLIEIKNPTTRRYKGDDSLSSSVGGFLISINSIALEAAQRCRHEKSPY